METKYRIVQVAPLNHPLPYKIQKSKKIRVVDREETDKLPYKGLIGGQVFKDEIEWVNVDNPVAVLQDAETIIENKIAAEQSYKTREQELRDWKATHGDFQVVKEY